MKRESSRLLSGMLLIAALFLWPVGVSLGTSLVSDSQPGRTIPPPDTEHIIEEGCFSHTRPVQLPVEARARCTGEEVPDPRTGTSTRATVFVGICPTDEPDDRCFVGVPASAARTGVELDTSALVPSSNAIPGTKVTVMDLGEICIETLPCIPVKVETEGRKTTVLGDKDDAKEVEVWPNSETALFLGPPQVCHSTHQNDPNVAAEHKCSGTGSGGATLENTSPNSWFGTP